LDKLAVPELIQVEFTSQHIQWRLKELLDPKSLVRKQQLSDYDQLVKLIGPAGASKKTAQLIVGSAQSAK
jgi:lipid A disaccharide synthetase